MDNINFIIRKNYKIKSKLNGLFGGITYLGRENIESMDNVSSLMFLGQSGSGKTYSLRMIKEAWKGKNSNIHLIVIDSKTKDMENESDYFTSLETDEDFRNLICYIKKIIKIADKANFTNTKLNCSYFFIFDECIDYLSKSPSDSKERSQLKLELVDLITHLVRKISRSQNCPVLFGSQNFSFGSLLLNQSYISKIFVSRLRNSQQCNTFGVPVSIGLSNELKMGRWIDTTDNQIIQFPMSLRQGGLYGGK